MLQTLAGMWKRYPATMAILSVSVVLMICVEVHDRFLPQDAENGFRRFGAVEPDSMIRSNSIVPGLYGLFDVWDGQIWRLLVTAFHHGNLAHLLMNGLGGLYLCPIAESRMRRSHFVAFFLIAGTVSVAVQVAIAPNAGAVGISGALCALLGLGMVLRRRDAIIARYLSQFTVNLTLLSLVVCVPLTHYRILPIANAAHFAGLVYGLLVGALIVCEPQRWVRRFGLALHLAIIPIIWCAVHPEWYPQYQWYRGIVAHSVSDRERHLREAVRLDPTLDGAWSDLASLQERNGRLNEAWATALTGLRHVGALHGSRLSFPRIGRPPRNLLLTSHRIWSRFSTDEQFTHACWQLVRTFGLDAGFWFEALPLPRTGVRPDGSLPPGFTGTPVAPVVPPDVGPVRPEAVDPNGPSSAMEGVTL